MRKLLKGVLHTAAPNERVLPWATKNNKPLDKHWCPTSAVVTSDRHRPDARERIGAQTARPGLPVPRSTLKNPAVFRFDTTRFVGRLEPSEIERNPVLDLAQ